MRFGWERQVTVQRWGSTWDSCRGERSSSGDGRPRETLPHPSPPLPLPSPTPPSVHLSIHPPDRTSTVSPYLVNLCWVWHVGLLFFVIHATPLSLHTYSLPWPRISHLIFFFYFFFYPFSKISQIPVKKKWWYSNWLFFPTLFVTMWHAYEAGQWSLLWFLSRAVIVHLFLHHTVLFRFIIKLFFFSFLNSLMLTHRNCLQAFQTVSLVTCNKGSTGKPRWPHLWYYFRKFSLIKAWTCLI